MTTVDPTHAVFGPPAATPGAAPANQAHPAGRFVRWARWAGPALAAGVIAAAGARALTSHAATPVHYETSGVDRGRIDAKVTATGTVSAIVTVQVGSQVSGRIEKLFVDFSSPVKKGQVVARIDPSLFKAATEQAQASYAAAKAAVEKSKAQLLENERVYARSRRLHDEGLASQNDLDVAEGNAEVSRADVAAQEANVVQARAALDQALLNLGYTIIVSPTDGTVISRNVDVGQTVAAAFQAPTLFTIAQDLTKMQVDTNVAEADVGKLREGMDVTFTVDAYPGRPFPGKVRQVRDAATIVQNVVTYDAVIDFSNDEHLLRPSMTASATFVYAQKQDVLRVPNGALRFKPDPATVAAMMGVPLGKAKADAGKAPASAPDQRAVWVLRDSKPVEVPVRVGITDGSLTEIVSGDVREGDAAITEAIVDGPAAKRP